MPAAPITVKPAGDGLRENSPKSSPSLATFSTDEIARTIGVNPKALRSALRRNGISLRAVREHGKKTSSARALGLAVRRSTAGPSAVYGAERSPPSRPRMPLACRRSLETRFAFCGAPGLAMHLIAAITWSEAFEREIVMAAKAKSAKKLPRLDLAEAPNGHRRQHSPFTRDILTPPGAPFVARHRARMLLTPLAVRRAIVEDAASKPEPVRARSLRRRLTVLDRALTDPEAEALDRLTTCIGGLSNIGCLNYLRSEVRSSPVERLPFSENGRIEIAAMNAVLKGLTPSTDPRCLSLPCILIRAIAVRSNPQTSSSPCCKPRLASPPHFIITGSRTRRGLRKSCPASAAISGRP